MRVGEVGGDRALEAVVVDSDVGAGVVVNIDILWYNSTCLAQDVVSIRGSWKTATSCSELHLIIGRSTVQVESDR